MGIFLYHGISKPHSGQWEDGEMTDFTQVHKQTGAKGSSDAIGS